MQNYFTSGVLGNNECEEAVSKVVEVINEDNWENKVPRLTRNKPFLWSRSKIFFTDGTVSISEPSKTSYTYIGFFDRIIMNIKKLFK